MPARDAKGSLVPTTWKGPDQFGSTRRGGAATELTLSVINRDADGFRTPYRHVRLHLKTANGEGEFLFNGDEAKQFAEELLVYARETQRVLAKNG